MNRFLLECRNALTRKTLQQCLVFGNESCDLDSAVCALSLAFHLTNHNESKAIDYYVPVLNVSREKLPIKSEVVHFLKKNEINISNVICWDEIYVPSFCSYILVDHHVTKLSPTKIKMVIDHRPRDPAMVFPPDTNVIIEEVGSCATLVAKYILENAANITDEEKSIFKLLYGAIVLDTVNFSAEADKARPLDVSIIAQLDDVLEITDVKFKEKLLVDLVHARADVLQLDSYQILFKDLKVIRVDERVIAIPGFPILVEDYVKMPNAVESLHRFAQELNCIIVLMGMCVSGSVVTRDLSVINLGSPKEEHLFNRIREELLNWPELQLREICSFPLGPIYWQENIKLSRKQLLPRLNQLLY